MKKKNGMSHPYELNPAILWSVKVCSCKQALCPDEILSSYYLNLNARSFVKWLGLRSPNRNKFSRVAKHNRKINSSLFCIGRHKLVFFSSHCTPTHFLTQPIYFFFSINVWKLHLSANNISSIRNSETKNARCMKTTFIYTVNFFFRRPSLQTILLHVWFLIV